VSLHFHPTDYLISHKLNLIDIQFLCSNLQPLKIVERCSLHPLAE
jgi:hypothetical protein